MKIYFIGICGTGVGNLAILLKKQGHDVKGSEVSEKFFYPPMADLIRANKIPVDFGFDPEKIAKDIDLIIMGGAALIHDPKNPQVQKAKDLGIELISYARGIGRFISKKENIEVVGNHGKTTTTAIIAHLLKQSGQDASYFLGGAAKGFEETIHSGESKWSVCEGDEYPSIGQEEGGKFLYHNPKHVLFTSADWDHKNIYKTQDDYLKTFEDLFKIIPGDGKVSTCFDGINVFDVLQNAKNNKINIYTLSLFKHQNEASESEIKKDIKCKLELLQNNYPKVYKNVENIYYVKNINYTHRSGNILFTIEKLNLFSNERIELGNFETTIIGQVGVENSLAAITTLHSLGFDIEKLRSGIKKFQGVMRKLELIYNKNYKVINDHAHSPIKIENALESIRTKYPNNNIFVIFDAHQSGLKERTTFNQLKNVFDKANYVLIPKVIPDFNSGDPIFGKDYLNLIKEGAKNSASLNSENIFYTPTSDLMQEKLQKFVSRDDVIVIMSSGDASEFIKIATNLEI